MTSRLPEGALAYYAALGPARTLKAVAGECGVPLRLVAQIAKRDGWDALVDVIEREAQRIAGEKLTAGSGDTRDRHRRLITAVAARAAKALQEHPLASGMEAIRAAEVAIRLERGLVQDAAARPGLDLRAAARREVRALLDPGSR